MERWCRLGLERAAGPCERDGPALGKGWAWWEWGAGRPSWSGLGPLLSLSYLFLKQEKTKKRRKRKEELGEEVGHADDFSGLTKIVLVPRK